MKTIITALFLTLISQSAFAKKCLYTLKPDSTEVKWTGYKFTEKAGATGTFKEVKVNTRSNAKSVQALVKSVQVDIDALKFDSGDPARDINLTKGFFNLFKNSKIKGRVISYKEDKMLVRMTMNGVSRSVPFQVRVDGLKYTAKAEIDILDFKLNSALAALNQLCKDLHVGPDGVLKTWSTVDLSLSSEIVEDCSKK